MKTRRQAVLDAAMIALGGGAIVWYLVLGPTAYADSGGLLANLIEVSYPIGDLVLIGALARLWTVAATTTQVRRSLTWLSVGVGLFVVGDVAYYWRQLKGGPEPYYVADRHNWRRSVKEMNAFRQAYPYSLIVPGHDPEFWPKLEKRYEAYTKDSEISVFIGTAGHGKTLEPQLLTSIGRDKLNAVFGTAFGTDADLLEHMTEAKTTCALRLLEKGQGLDWPKYISDAVAAL